MESGSFDSGKYGDHIGVGLVEICKKCATQDDISMYQIHFDGV